MTRFLCTADLHIGRESSGFGGDASTTAIAAFERIVDIALSEGVDAVLVAGDLFDGESGQYASRDRVARGLERLKSRGIPTIAVAGNHDHAALPTFARAYPELLHLFDSDRPEPVAVGGVRVVGCSFRGAQDGRLLERISAIEPGTTVVGLMHADVDASSGEGRYNPVVLSELRGRGVGAWVLGHVHATRVWDAPFAFYPGSPQALDAGEAGIHGVRLLSIDQGRIEVSETYPVSTVRYETTTVEVGEGETLDMAVERTVDGLRSGSERIDLRARVRWLGSRSAPPPGRTSLGDAIHYSVIEESEVRRLDLDSEVLQGDARGQAARLLLGLDQRGEPAWQASAERMVREVAHQMAVHRRNHVESHRADERFRRLLSPVDEGARRAVRRALEAVLHADRTVER